MRTLVVCRHAKAASQGNVDDFDRPLTERGRRDAGACGRWLREHVPHIERALCSPAVRARTTWELITNELATVPALHESRIYEATAGELIALVNELTDEVDTAALIGHNPGLQDLVSVLTGASHELKTTGVAVLTVNGTWAMFEPRAAELQEISHFRG